MLYRDVWDQKPPGIHLTYALGFTLFGASDRTVLLLDAAAATIACLCVFAIARRLASERAAWASAIVFAAGTYPAFALPYGGFLERAVPETFITALAAMAAWCAVRSRFGLAGLAIGTAAIFKPTALIYWPVLALAGGLRFEARGSELRDAEVRGSGFVFREALRAIALSGATLLIPIVAVIVWLWANGAIGDARIAVFDYNRAYVVAGSSWLALPNILAHELWRLVKTDPLWCVAAIGGVTTILNAEVRMRDETGHWQLPLFSLAWLAAVLVAVAANGVRMYATYFLPAAPPLALLAGSLFRGGPENPRYRARVLICATAIVLAGIVAVHSHYPDRLVRYTAADLAQLRDSAYLDGSARRAAYLEMFGGYANGRGYSARANAELAAYLRDHTADADRVYIFGMAPAVYFDAKRLPANRFVWTFPAVAPFAGNAAFTIDALAANLTRTAPPCLVLERNNRDSSTGWRVEDVYAAPSIRRLFAGYVKLTDIEDFSVLARSASLR